VIIDEDELDVVLDAREELGSTEGLGSTEEEEDRLSLEDEEVVGTLVVKTVEVSVTTVGEIVVVRKRTEPLSAQQLHADVYRGSPLQAPAVDGRIKSESGIDVTWA